MTTTLPSSRRRGRVSKGVLFKGSKSEREFFVLNTTEHRYRIYFEDSTGEQLLAPWLEQTVDIEGNADDRRGHWRLSVTNDQLRGIGKDSVTASAADGSVPPLSQMTVQVLKKSDDSV